MKKNETENKNFELDILEQLNAFLLYSVDWKSDLHKKKLKDINYLTDSFYC